MIRPKIIFPLNTLGTFSIPVRITDINYGNHLGNDSLVSIIHEARMQWLTSNHFTELNIEGTGLIMAALSIDYKAEAFYGDVLEIEIAVGEIAPVRFELFYRLSTIKDGERKLIALAQTLMVSYDYEHARTVKIPGCLMKLLTNENL